ncbi:acyl-protein synthetase [Clostridium hydrogeniformans]|uniref:LuxE/PaaK family acyltransferase n=1 Tax=Clostridium hydrogeniformans TaxID=349933 RepID=UPI000484900A|nr:acyl-protein synthetase [Clostridium hydrogeniformans]
MERVNFFMDYKKNLVQQYNQCAAYKLLCDNQGFNPSINLKSENDMDEVPYFTTTLFKKSHGLFKDLLRVPADKLDKWTVSSSTSGDPSIVGRRTKDIIKIKEFIEREKSLKSLNDYDCVFYPEPEVMKKYKSQVILGKSTESYIGNMLDIFNFSENTIFLIKPDKEDLTIDMDSFKAFLEDHNNMDHNLSIRGSTILLFDSVNKLKDNMKPVKLGKNAIIHTGGGGWDGKKGNLSMGSALRRQDFVEIVSEFLGVPKENFVDSYSFTENSFPITGHYSKEYKDYLFHIPTWGRVMIRDIKTLKPLKNEGDKGFIQMLNAYGTSAFAGASILVDDIGEIVSMEECPECGSKLMTIRILGRVKGSEAKGCGATLNVKEGI